MNECDGTDPIVIETRQCTVSLTSLRALPLGLVFNSYVVVRVNSMNSFGWSINSQPCIGDTKILTEPIKMPTPIYTPSLSANDTIFITLIGLTKFEQTGGSAVDSYYLEYSIDNTNVWTEI